MQLLIVHFVTARSHFDDGSLTQQTLATICALQTAVECPIRDMPPTDNYIFWSAPARKEEEEEEEEISFEDALPQESEVLDHPNEKGKGRESMYVSLVECKSFTWDLILRRVILMFQQLW